MKDDFASYLKYSKTLTSKLYLVYSKLCDTRRCLYSVQQFYYISTKTFPK